MIREGFKKVDESGGTYVVARFFNPETKEEYGQCVRDYDYADCSRDDDEAYYAPIDEEARAAWIHFNGGILVGDTVKVVKGRKLPIGTVWVVDRIYDWKDCYGRVQTTYVVFKDGKKTSIGNVVLLGDNETVA